MRHRRYRIQWTRVRARVRATLLERLGTTRYACYSLDPVTDSQRNLFDKVWDLHSVRELSGGQTQLFIGLHLIHEVTTPQAFDELREMGLGVRFPSRTFATADHIIPTDGRARPFADPQAEAMMAALERNLEGTGIAFFGPGSGKQGIVHVIGPELGLTQPGMTIACGDSHTSTHGAFGAIASRGNSPLVSTQRT